GLASMEYVDFHGKRHHKGLGTSILRREPIGVCAGIVPWNYPLYIACWKFAPALAAGNSIVLKPASLTPLTLLEFCELVKKAGFPEGVFNVVTGPGEVIGAALAESPKVDMISLTGDVSTGKKIMQQSSGSLKKVHLELGGKAPLIVLEDADLDAVAEGACVGGYWNAGQDCTAVTRVYVPERLHDELVGKMVDVTKRFKLGDPSKESTDEGPMVSERQREKVEYYVELARKEGAKIEVGGKRPTGKEFEKGWYYEPTILTNVKHRSRVCQEEIFGPVVAVFKYKALEDAVKAANDVAYGLAASVWGKDITKCNYVARKLDFGTVWVNEHGILTSETPHGGFKQSGYGKDLSLHALEEYTRTKHVYIDQTGLKRKPWHYVVYGRP
ncbi:MAG TPA: aldehyde dehydrogenase family protein, partial [archaeon]|nr:aldehyde dehydrogenase family protein [archaeon]